MSIQSDQVCNRIISNNRKISALEKKKKAATAEIKQLQLDSAEAITEFEEENIDG